MTSKERTKLRALASELDAVFQVGKGGITENVMIGLSEALDSKELIKISVLKNAAFSAKELLLELAKSLKAEPIAAIGNKIVLFRRSLKEGIKHIEV